MPSRISAFPTTLLNYPAQLSCSTILLTIELHTLLAIMLETSAGMRQRKTSIIHFLNSPWIHTISVILLVKMRYDDFDEKTNTS